VGGLYLRRGQQVRFASRRDCDRVLRRQALLPCQLRYQGGHGPVLRALPGLLFYCGCLGVPVGRNGPSRHLGLRYYCGLRVFS
jgi:hypothetical protein